MGIADGRLKIKTTAPPTDGRANKDVTRQLAIAFNVPRSRISLRKGANSRLKTFVIDSPSIIPDWMRDLGPG